MKKLILPLFLLFICLNSNSQVQVTTTLITCNNENQSNPNNWVSYLDNQEFKIEFRFADCDLSSGYDFEAVLFKVTNKTAQKLYFNWQNTMYYAGTCRTCDFPEEYEQMLSVGPNEVLEGDCGNVSGNNLKMFSRFNDQNYTSGDPLTAFQLDDFMVTQY